MTTEHPITPPPELIRQWNTEAASAKISDQRYIATQAARWGSDQELEECCKWLPKLPPWSADDLRRHRRPKPPSLKEQALAALAAADGADHPVVCTVITADQHDIIRRALEQLPDD